jgi:hypothetical protein
MRTLRVVLSAVVLVELLGACVGGNSARPASAPPPSAQQRALEQYRNYAGPPIPYFVWLGRLYSWEPLGKDRLVIFTTTNEAYLLTVWPPARLPRGSHATARPGRAAAVQLRDRTAVLRARGVR